MTDLNSTEREDRKLQADPVLILSDGRATFGQKLFSVIAATAVVLGTLYGLAHQHGKTPRNSAVYAVDGAVLPGTVGQAR